MTDIFACHEHVTPPFHEPAKWVVLSFKIEIVIERGFGLDKIIK